MFSFILVLFDPAINRNSCSEFKARQSYIIHHNECMQFIEWTPFFIADTAPDSPSFPRACTATPPSSPKSGPMNCSWGRQCVYSVTHSRWTRTWEHAARGMASTRRWPAGTLSTSRTVPACGDRRPNLQTVCVMWIWKTASS